MAFRRPPVREPLDEAAPEPPPPAASARSARKVRRQAAVELPGRLLAPRRQVHRSRRRRSTRVRANAPGAAGLRPGRPGGLCRRCCGNQAMPAAITQDGTRVKPRAACRAGSGGLLGSDVGPRQPADQRGQRDPDHVAQDRDDGQANQQPAQYACDFVHRIAVLCLELLENRDCHSADDCGTTRIRRPDGLEFASWLQAATHKPEAQRSRQPHYASGRSR